MSKPSNFKLLGSSTVERVMQMSNDEITLLSQEVDELLDARERALMAKKKSKEELLKLYSDFGYQIPPKSKFWRINSTNPSTVGYYGLEIGKVVHSCHIDSTDIFILFVVTDKGQAFAVDVAEHWLDDPIET